MSKRFYRILSFIVFFSFPLVDSMAQRLSSVPENKTYSEQEVKSVDAISSSSHNGSRTTATSASIATTITDVNCYGSSSGKISYTISGGIPPYRYQWSSGTNGYVYGNCWYNIKVTNPGSTTLTDYQVMVTVPYAPAAGMNADFSNVSFYDTTNTISYTFWRESTLNNNGVFWIKLPSFPPGDFYIRVSFCSASTTSLSNGLATFDYFDDFDDMDISDWTHTCNDVNYPDEVCNADVQQVNGSDYAAQLSNYAHCIGGPTPTVGVNDKISKTVGLPNGQYWVDISSKFLICLRTICSDSSRIYSRIYLDNVFYSAFFLEKNTTCGCALSGWTQIRANGPHVNTGTPITYDLRTELTDCGEGSLQYDNFRIRKWYVDPVVTIDIAKPFAIDNLLAGDYTLTVTDGEGTVTTQTYTVHGPDLPQSNDYNTCGQSPATLVATGTYTAFKWYDVATGGSSLFTGATYTTDSLDHDQVFYLTGIGTDGCESSPRVAVKTTVLSPASSNNCLTVYTGISPNGDGMNESWEIKGIESYPDNNVKVFDRWGNIVFEKDSYNNLLETTWKGTSNKGLSKGQDLPNGTYYYEIDIKGLNKPLSGFVILNREQ
jgi:gliding motility-associated-like protein